MQILSYGVEISKEVKKYTNVKSSFCNSRLDKFGYYTCVVE